MPTQFRAKHLGDRSTLTDIKADSGRQMARLAPTHLNKRVLLMPIEEYLSGGTHSSDKEMDVTASLAMRWSRYQIELQEARGIGPPTLMIS